MWMHFDIFGRNVTDKVSNQKTLHCATPSNLCFCTSWQNVETRKSHLFHSNAVSVHLLPECIVRIQLVPSWFLQSFWLKRLTLTLLYGSLNLVINALSSGLGGMVQEKGSQERRSSWTVLHAQCMCTSALSSCDVFDSVWYLLRQYNIPLILSINFHSRLDEEQLPSFTQRPTPCDRLGKHRAWACGWQTASHILLYYQSQTSLLICIMTNTADELTFTAVNTSTDGSSTH